MDEIPEVGITGEAEGRALTRVRHRSVERVRGDERRAGSRSRHDRALDPVVDRNVLSEADRDGMRCLGGITVVVRELEPRQDEQAVRGERALRLALYVLEIEVEPVGGHAGASDPRARTTDRRTARRGR